MEVARLGRDLAVRLPADVVERLGLQEGDDVTLRIAADRAIEVERSPPPLSSLRSLRHLRGRLPTGFRFDRDINPFRA